MREGKEAPTEVQRRAAQVRQREERKYTVSGGEMRLIAMSARAKVCAMMGANWGCAWTRRCGRPKRFCTTRASATRPCRWTQSWRRAPRCRWVPRRRALRGGRPGLGVEGGLEVACVTFQCSCFITTKQNPCPLRRPSPEEADELSSGESWWLPCRARLYMYNRGVGISSVLSTVRACVR